MVDKIQFVAKNITITANVVEIRMGIFLFSGGFIIISTPTQKIYNP